MIFVCPTTGITTASLDQQRHDGIVWLACAACVPSGRDWHPAPEPAYRCSGACKQYLPASAFGADRSRYTGLASRCAACQRQHALNTYHKRRRRHADHRV